ncbi:hypothetical protein [Nocardia fluminea]|uniref:hypothetical protein n=1 Tax=Nocardia fluminea TaxID=134984 RepID=UPI00341EFF98
MAFEQLKKQLRRSRKAAPTTARKAGHHLVDALRAISVAVGLRNALQSETAADAKEFVSAAVSYLREIFMA